MKNTIGLYIHIPFCVKKCAYCDFCSYENALSKRDDYIDALCKEMSSYKEELSSRIVDTIYVGGGTPSMLTPSQIIRLGNAIRENCNIAPDAEFTFEVNPQSGISEIFAAAKEIGVNRISMGLQSADDRLLRIIGRSHDVRRFDECFDAARSAGFENISLDLMTGLPSQTLSDLEASIDYAVSKKPEHISAYALKIEEGTPFHKIEDTLDLPDEDMETAMYHLMIERLKAYGYEQYEISNFARDGFYSRHNTRYWLGQDYLGLGVSAHSYMNGERFYNEDSLDEYMSAVNEGRTPVCERDKIEGDELIEEYIMLRLRLKAGLDPADFENRFGISFEPLMKRCEPFIEKGLMQKNSKYIRLTPDGFLVSNYIISDLILEI